MAGVVLTEMPKGGFSFELCKRWVMYVFYNMHVCMDVSRCTKEKHMHTVCRNEVLRRAGINFPKPVKTGTTIAGVIYKVST